MIAVDELDEQLEDKHSPLFDLFLTFQDTFATKAIDELDISNDEAERVAIAMEKSQSSMGIAYAHFMRCIGHARMFRELSFRAAAVWAADVSAHPSSTPRPVTEIDEIHARFEKMRKGSS